MAQTLTLKALFGHLPRDIEAVQRVFEASPIYWTLTQGKPYEAGTASETFEALPPGKTYDDKFVLGVAQGQKVIGCIDLIRAWPNAETAMLGLLVLAETHQGRGLGSETFRLIEDYARAWPGMRTIRIGVLILNESGMKFWKKLGFHETGERKPHHEGTVVSEVIVLEKPLA